MKRNTFTIAGLMSGTSLDGLDIAVCQFQFNNGVWNYKTIAADTIEYSESFKQELNLAMKMSGEDLIALDRRFGSFQGNAVSDFLHKNNLTVDLISAHGHTIFHNPAKGYTLQIGSGASLYAAATIPVVTDLRSVDIAFGGQGAPLVPLGDELLFSGYDGCLNLGGIANISFVTQQKNSAYDICAVNIVLNKLVSALGKSYDDGGTLAKSGTLLPDLLERLESLPYYRLPYPKSLGREWVDEIVFPILEEYKSHSIKDLLHTYAVHCAKQIAASIAEVPAKQQQRTILITGGGAFNTFLIDTLRLQLHSDIVLTVPDAETVQYKEAIIFGFLGLLRILNRPNAKSTVTGASRDSIGGAIYGDISDFYGE